MVYDATLEKLLLILPSNWCHLGDLLVHKWLGETWLILLVMAHFTVTDEINHDIMLELLTILSSSSEDKVNIVKAISVHMENWSVDGFSKI